MRVQFAISSALLCIAAFSGCDGPAASFVLNSKTGDLAPVARDPVQAALLDKFGTPNQLVGWQKFPIDYGAADPAAEDASRHKAGWKLKHGRNLYMLHCLHCHGVSGDGNGPTARFLNPRPRDYRLGKFKFTSTQGPLKPSRTDLKHTLKLGIPGTTMPSFVLVPDGDLDALVEYVRWLSTRGEFELKLDNDMIALGAVEKEIARRVAEGRKAEGGETREKIVQDLETSIKEEFKENVNNDATDIAEAWTKADEPDAVIVPKSNRVPPTPKSLERGKKLYFSKTAKCADCHGAAGRGDGSLTEDFWAIPGTSPERKYAAVGLHDDWGFSLKPRNLQRGVYRGGRRPVDLYRRVFAGIKGTPMPGFGTVLKDPEIWDLVNYVMSLPFDGKASAQPFDAGKPGTEKKVASSKDNAQRAGN